MAVAKRQRKKPTKMEQKENPWTGVKSLRETNTPPSWLAQFAQGRLSREETEHIKRGSQEGLRPLLWGRPIHTPRWCTFIYLPNKTNL